MAAMLKVALFVCLSVVLSAAEPDNAAPLPIGPGLATDLLRKGKNLLANNPKFPFKRIQNARGNHGDATAHHAHHHDDAHHHHGEQHGRAAVPANQFLHTQANERVAFRQDAGDAGDATLAVGEGEQRCVEKVMMIESTEYERELICQHSYDKSCHSTYTTEYVPHQEEVCNENFEKNCFIEYKTDVIKHDVVICSNPLIKNCDIEAPEICESLTKNECETKLVAHPMVQDEANCTIVEMTKCEPETRGYKTEDNCSVWPTQVCEIVQKNITRHTEEVNCELVPYEVCGPGPCPTVPGPEVCRTEERQEAIEKPHEKCDLVPISHCKYVTKLIPKLKPTTSCYDVPKEICEYSKRVPRKVMKPVIKKWCFTPEKEGYADAILGNDDDQTTEVPDAEETTADTPAF